MNIVERIKSAPLWIRVIIMIPIGSVMIWTGFNQMGIKTTIDQAVMWITIYALSIVQYFHYPPRRKQKHGGS